MKAQQHLQYKSHSIVWCLFSPRIGIIQRLHFIQSSTSMSVHIEDTTIIAMVRIAQARILVGRKVKSAPKDLPVPPAPPADFEEVPPKPSAWSSLPLRPPVSHVPGWTQCPIRIEKTSFTAALTSSTFGFLQQTVWSTLPTNLEQVQCKDAQKHN